MPKPIVPTATLHQFRQAFRSCSSKRQWKYFVIVLLGLIEREQRRTLSGLLANIGEPVSLSGLSRFFHRWKWQTEELARIWLSRFRRQLRAEVEAEHHRQERHLRLGRRSSRGNRSAAPNPQYTQKRQARKPYNSHWRRRKPPELQPFGRLRAGVVSGCDDLSIGGAPGDPRSES